MLPVLVAVLACVAASAVAQQQPHVLTNMPPSGAVTTGFMFPTYPGKKFPAGKMVDVVVGIHNDGSDSYNISMITGSLNSPVDFNVHVQNFTNVGYGQVVKPGEELSLEYKFFPDPRLEPRDFIVALTAFYSDSKGNWHSTTFFNQTVEIVEVKKLIDWELLFMFALFGAAIGGIAYWVYSYIVSLGWLKPQKKRAAKKRAQAQAGAVMSAEDHEEWIKGTNWDAHRKAGTRSKSPAKTK
mmetsp:Transcript_12282/g.30014  ORF Transcript_12282/g.30014 Transcript_12282/m.30014 type:complete len:240 (-) Transcript_12282:716-1435(-)